MAEETVSNLAATAFIARHRRSGHTDESILVIAQNDRDSGHMAKGTFSWVRQILNPEQDSGRTHGGLARGADDVDHAGPEPLPLSSGPATIPEETRLIELLQGSDLWPAEWRNRWNGLPFDTRQRLVVEAGPIDGVYSSAGPREEEGYDEVAETIADFEKGDGGYIAGGEIPAEQRERAEQRFANGGVHPKWAQGLKHRAAASARYFPSQTPTPTMHELSMRLRAAVVDLGTVLESLDGQADARNLSMAKTSLEDVQMRANRALHSPTTPRVTRVDLNTAAGVDVQKFIDETIARTLEFRDESKGASQ